MIEVDQEQPWVRIFERTDSMVRGIVEVIAPAGRISVGCQVNAQAYRRSQPQGEREVKPANYAVLSVFLTKPDEIDDAIRDEVTNTLDATAPRLWQRAHDPDAADVLIPEGE